MHLLFVFLDGVGLGPADAAVNPFAALDLPAFDRLAGGQRWTDALAPVDEPGHVVHGIDANLDVEGLPQSGTGQAALFTGVNCAQVAGRHFGPYPHSQTRPVLAEHNLFAQVQRLGLPLDEPAAFVNAYPPRFFTYVKKRDRWTVTTRSALDAGLTIRDTTAFRDGAALTADLTGAGWIDLGVEGVTPITEADAGARLHALGRRHACTLYEYFLTDKAGHLQAMDKAAPILTSLDRFFAGLLDRLDPERDLLLVTSDHGNLEDLGTKTHTRYPVPLIAYGHGAHHFRAARSILDVTPLAVEALRAAWVDGSPPEAPNP